MPVSYSPALDVADDPAYDPTDKPFVPAAGSAAALLFYDTFTDTPYTDIELHTPDTDNSGSGWTRTGDAATDCRISSTGTTLEVTGATGEGAYVTNSESSYIFQFAPTNNGNRYALLRWVDNSNYWYVQCNEGSGTNDFRIIEVDAGSFTVRTTVSSGTASKTSFWVSDDGTTISAGLDGGSAEASYSSTLHNTSQKFGFVDVGDAYVVDNLLAYTGTTDPSALVTP